MLTAVLRPQVDSFQLSKGVTDQIVSAYDMLRANQVIKDGAYPRKKTCELAAGIVRESIIRARLHPSDALHRPRTIDGASPMGAVLHACEVAKGSPWVNPPFLGSGWESVNATASTVTVKAKLNAVVWGAIISARQATTATTSVQSAQRGFEVRSIKGTARDVIASETTNAALPGILFDARFGGWYFGPHYISPSRGIDFSIATITADADIEIKIELIGTALAGDANWTDKPHLVVCSPGVAMTAGVDSDTINDFEPIVNKYWLAKGLILTTTQTTANTPHYQGAHYIEVENMSVLEAPLWLGEASGDGTGIGRFEPEQTGLTGFPLRSLGGEFARMGGIKIQNDQALSLSMDINQTANAPATTTYCVLPGVAH